jgi:LacI family transcriptional regulator
MGHDVFLEHVNKYGPPRGVFATGDFQALGAIRACRELGLSVPEQVAVIGATGLEVAAYSHPSLTVLDTPMENMGADAAAMLLEMAREGVRRMSGRYAKANLTVRESCPIPTEVLAEAQATIDGRSP